MEKNFAKYYSYKVAWGRINNAISKKYFLEAITLEESIMSDRIWSYLEGVGCKTNHKIFNTLIKDWKKVYPDPIEYPRIKISGRHITSLQEEVDKWRNNRNFVIHGLVKSKPGTPTQNVPDFLKLAKTVAEDGKKLARAVTVWQRKQLRKALKNKTKLV